MATPDDKILVEMTSTEALVPFELLVRWDGENDAVPLSPRHVQRGRECR